MHEFEYIVESFKVPWLICIQLLITVLLVLLLFVGFNVVSLDPTADVVSGQSSDPSLCPKQRVVDNRSVEHLGTSTSGAISSGVEGEDASLLSYFRRKEHPCHYLGLAKQAFLKCFGFDFSSDKTKHGKQD